jgi:hypothetical protein
VNALSIAPGFSQGLEKEENNAAGKTQPGALSLYAAEQDKTLFREL